MLSLEQLPDKGVGSLKRKRIWAEISGSRLTPEQLFERFRRDFNEATPGIVDAQAEAGNPVRSRDGSDDHDVAPASRKYSGARPGA